MSYAMIHCDSLSDYSSLKGRVLTIKTEHSRPFDVNDAVFLCLDDKPENGCLHVMGSRHRECSILYDDFLGVLKKDCISENFKREIAGIPIKKACQNAAYYGYALDDTGYHTLGTPLADIRDVEDYINLQKNIQHEIRITDMDDCLLLKMVEGQLIFPDKATMEQSQHVTMAQTM